MVYLEKYLERIKEELQELIGVLSIEELVTNRRFTSRYEKLQYEFVKII